ncbi:MAG: 3-deoxy-manno-octulosonate cytidylyltransferase [Phycisphaerae bacterium]|jgi:3-deoxy-manno-octulosonate cytidylyltransferase (CMP-KDO synthetase)
MSDAIAIIPARLGSTRFPRKVLAARTGKPLIRHVWERARNARSLARVVIATDDAEVLEAVRSFGGEAVMTSPSHPNGSSRLAEAASILRLPEDALVVNVQGDEPEMDPAVIDAAVALARSSGAEVATVASPLAAHESFDNPNIVKVVLRADGMALYFSRAMIPFPRQGGAAGTPEAAPVLKHVGLYVYRAGFLARYVTLAPTPLERTEMLEQLRVLEHGHRIAVVVHACDMVGVDTPEQYEAFVAREAARSGR